MSHYRIVQDYSHSPAKVWRALTDPALVPLWTATGQGARPIGFATQVGTRFQFVGKPTVGWNAPDEVTEVSCRIEPREGGTRLIFEHTGFSGVGGFIVGRILASVRRKMLAVGLPAVLDALDEEGRLRPGSPLAARP
jgi:hypothetical protein